MSGTFHVWKFVVGLSVNISGARPARAICLLSEMCSRTGVQECVLPDHQLGVLCGLSGRMPPPPFEARPPKQVKGDGNLVWLGRNGPASSAL